MTGPMSQPLVSIVIPTLYLKRPRNTQYLLSKRFTLSELLRDLQENAQVPVEVIVICNGAAGELRTLVTTHPQIDKYALNSVNVGVSRAWNMGAMMAEGDALCFLNDDVEVGPGGLAHLHQVLATDPSVGVVGPRGAVWRGAQHDRYVGEREPANADNISGFCFMVRTELFHRVGGFDIAYTPAGFEEIDFCFAVRQLGYHCRVIPGLPITHHYRHGVSASHGTVEYLHRSTDTRSLHERNKAYFKRKWQIPD
jgi:GT2 family glycosyltransferase